MGGQDPVAGGQRDLLVHGGGTFWSVGPGTGAREAARSLGRGGRDGGDGSGERSLGEAARWCDAPWKGQ